MAVCAFRLEKTCDLFHVIPREDGDKKDRIREGFYRMRSKGRHKQTLPRAERILLRSDGYDDLARKDGYKLKRAVKMHIPHLAEIQHTVIILAKRV